MLHVFFSDIAKSKLHNNRLTSLPLGGDFHSLSITDGTDGHLQLQGNRLTRVSTDAFKSLTTRESM